MNSLEVENIFPSLREIIIEDDAIPMAVFDDCRIHWLLILLIAIFIVYSIIRVIRNEYCIRALEKGKVPENGSGKKYYGGWTATIVYLISVVVTCFFWECEKDLIVTVVALVVAMISSTVFACQNRRISDMRPYERLISSKA